MIPTVFKAPAFLVAMAPPPGDGSPAWVSFVPFAMILAIFYFVILMPMRTA